MGVLSCLHNETRGEGAEEEEEEEQRVVMTPSQPDQLCLSSGAGSYCLNDLNMFGAYQEDYGGGRGLYH